MPPRDRTVSAAPAAPAIPLPPLPTWTSATSVGAFLVLALGFVGAFLTALHPGWTEPTAIAAVIPPAAIIISSVFVLVLVALHRKIGSTAGTPTIPSLTDAGGVLSILTTIANAAFAIVTAFHPGFSEPPVVNAVLPTVATLVAAAAQLINVQTHHTAVAAAHARALKIGAS